MVVDLQEVVTEIPLDYFRGRLLPDLKDTIPLNDVMAAMHERGYITDGRWTLWPEDPCDTKQANGVAMHENKVFERLETLASQVLEALRSVQKGKPSEPDVPAFVFRCNPSCVPKSKGRSSLSRPDAYGIRSSADAATDGTAKAEWIDVAVPGEFKKAAPGADTNDNNVKVLWSMHHIMRDDIRRRFVFGFTMENRTMRLWYCSRSEVLTSETFDWFEQHEIVCDFLLRIMFAQRQQLGWDPTVKVIPPTPADKNTQYEFTVHDVSKGNVVERTYRTKELLWNFGAEPLRGRGTRVWVVTEVVDGVERGGRRVLKEAWRDEDRDPEGAIGADMKANILRSTSGVERQVVEEMLMEAVAYGDVLVEGRPDRTHSFKACRAEAPPLSDDLPVIRVAVMNADKRRLVGIERRGQTVVDASKRKKSDVLQYPVKIHHRTVFKDVGQPLLHVESLSKVFDSLIDVLLGLQLMHKNGWVHRDISYGNILHVKTPASDESRERITSTKITDLEYAKRISANTTHRGVRTGTPYFMAIEVAHDSYVFETVDEGPTEQLSIFDIVRKRKRESEIPEQEMVTNQAVNEDTTQADPLEGNADDNERVWFRHNPLHDLESVAWLGLYLVAIPEFENDLRRDGSRRWGKDEFAAFMRAQHQLAWNAFCRPAFRSFVLKTPGYLARFIKGLHPTVANVVVLLSKVFSILHNAYVEAEKSVRPGMSNVLDTNHLGVNQRICAEMAKISSMLRKQDLFLVKDLSARRYRPKDIDQPATEKTEGTRSQTGGAIDEDGGSEECIGVDGSPVARRSKIPRTGRAEDAGSSSTRTQQRLEALAARIEDANLSDDADAPDS